MATSTGLKLSTLSYVIIYVRDTEKSVVFYRDKLGMAVKVNDPGWVELETGATTLALHRTESMPEVKDGHACMVFNVDNVYEAARALKSSGVTLKEEPRKVCEEGDMVGMSADFTDPDGNLLSVFSMVPKN